jgi:hypothetical protein
MNQHRVTWPTILTLAVLGLGILGLGLLTIARRQAQISPQQSHQAQIGPQQSLEGGADELRAILAILQTAQKETDDWKAAWQRFVGWMDHNVIRGKTTEADIVTWFGKDFQNLDRPGRDDVRTIEYQLLNDYSWGRVVVFDFDPRTRILRDWQYSDWLCGFCPHVLADDGHWRLEGKMLAGRLGAEREGSDTLLLPRLLPQNHTLAIRVANWAAEMEYIDQVQLGVVPCEPGWDVDMDDEGQPYVWKAKGAVAVESARQRQDGDGWVLSVGDPGTDRVIVLEVRNTGEFESAMRKAVLRPGAPWPPALLSVAFDDGTTRHVHPVGTKFLRRIVVPVPSGGRTVKLSAPAQMWLLQRAWLGEGRLAPDVAWLSGTGAEGANVDAVRLLRDRDAERLVLGPMEEVDLHFRAPEPASPMPNQPFILRMWGYYEFLPTAREPMP